MIILTINPKNNETEINTLDIKNMAVKDLIEQYPELKNTVHSQLVELKGTEKAKKEFVESANRKDNRKRTHFYEDTEEVAAHFCELKQYLKEVSDAKTFDYYHSIKNEIEFYLHNEFNFDVDFEDACLL